MKLDKNTCISQEVKTKKFQSEEKQSNKCRGLQLCVADLWYQDKVSDTWYFEWMLHYWTDVASLIISNESTGTNVPLHVVRSHTDKSVSLIFDIYRMSDESDKNGFNSTKKEKLLCSSTIIPCVALRVLNMTFEQMTCSIFVNISVKSECTTQF